jgi:hypothetical protein
MIDLICWVSLALGAMILSMVIALVIALVRAPLGYQDRNGFHRGKRPEREG